MDIIITVLIAYIAYVLYASFYQWLAKNDPGAYRAMTGKEPEPPLTLAEMYSYEYWKKNWILAPLMVFTIFMVILCILDYNFNLGVREMVQEFFR